MKLKLMLVSSVVMGAGLLIASEVTNPCQTAFEKCEKERSSLAGRFVSYYQTCLGKKIECNKIICEQQAESAWQLCNKSGGNLYGSKSCERRKKEIFEKCLRDAGLEVEKEKKPCTCPHKHDHKNT